MSKRQRELYEFGPFVLNPAERLLLRDERPVSLRPKAFDLLLLLAGRPNHLFEKNELMDALWPEDVVEEGNLKKTVSALRRALGEVGDGADYIETVSKYGYRFVADVRTVARNGTGAELLIETQTRASVVVEEEVDDEPPAAGDSALPAEARPDAALTGSVAEITHTLETAAPTSALPAAGSDRRLKRWAVPVAAAVVIALAAAGYLYYFRNGGEAIDSVAVLPLFDTGGDPDAEYLADGISDGVISSLSRLPELRVISLGSVLRFKGKQVDPQAVGRELNVRAVLVGRMTRLGDALLISAELVDVRDNRRLWGGQYNRKPSDVLAVQEEIAGEIAEKLRLRLSAPVKERLTKQSTGSTAAYDAYARGRFLLQKRTGRPTRKSVEYFEEAIRHDRGYGPAYASLSYAYWTLGNFGMIPQEEALSKAEEAAKRALEIDDTLAEAHSALGHVRHTRWDWAGAESAFRRGVELNPNSAFAHSNYAFYFIAVKRFDEAVAVSKRAVELEPTSALYNRNAALNLYFARRYDETIEQSLKTLELDPNMTTAYWWLARAYEQKGLHDQAVETYLRGEELSGTDVAPLREAYAASGWEGYWRKSLELTKQQAAKRRVDSWDMAGIYARLGEKEQAFAWLEKAYGEPNWSITTLNADPVLDGLRSDPRYADLVRRMGLKP